LAKELRLGNLDAQRDWGFAGDYVRAMWLMLQGNQPADYVISSGQFHSVRNLCLAAFAAVGLDYRKRVTADPAFYHPAEAHPWWPTPARPSRLWAGRRMSVLRRWSR
jgi:GDPmannose 4,6-dehydratase